MFYFNRFPVERDRVYSDLPKKEMAAVKAWFDEWGVWLVTVIILISLGAMLGKDFQSFAGFAQGFTALGTLLLGMSSLIAVTTWKRQEVQKFKAKLAAKLYSQIYQHSTDLQHHAQLLRGRMIIEEHRPSDSSFLTVEETRERLKSSNASLFLVMSENVEKEAALLGESFFRQVSEIIDLQHRLDRSLRQGMTISDSELSELDSQLTVCLKMLLKHANFRDF